MSAARRQLEEATAAISTAAMVLAGVEETLARFMDEKRRMDSIGPILHPTLFNSEERRATEAMLAPLFKAGLDFVQLYKAQLAHAAGALAKVKADG